MQLKYECSDDTLIDLMKNPVFAQESESLLDNKWNYTTIASVGNMAKIKSFYKDVQESSLKLSIMADSAEQFNKINYQLHRCFERDIRNLTPGKLWWNDFYKEVFVIDCSNNEFEEYFESVEKSCKVISLYSFWIKKNIFRYSAAAGNDGLLDYPYDYGFDYDCSQHQEIINNEGIGEANFEIVFYGPAENPCVTVNGHDYELFTTLGEGEYAVINSITKKIKQYSIKGEETNIFHLRNKENYVFKKIPEGINFVSRNRFNGVDITLYDERGEPEWI